MEHDQRDESRETRSHEHRIEVPAPVEDVWRAITDARELARWFPLEARVEPGPGGAITYVWDELVGRCGVEVWQAPHRLRTTWFEFDRPREVAAREHAAVRVEWTLEPHAGGTRLKLVHSGFGRDARWDDEYDGTRRGWAFELQSLKHYLAHHRGKERNAFWLRRPVRESAETAWSRLERGLLRSGRLRGYGEGSPYRLELRDGRALEGHVLVEIEPTDFAVTVEGLGDALLRFGYERMPAGPEIVLWLSTWGRGADEIARARSGFETLLHAALS